MGHQANGLTVKVASGEQMIAMTFGPEQRQLMQQAVKASAGRSLRFSVASGGAKNARRRRRRAPVTRGWRARQGGATSGGAANDGKIRCRAAHRARQRSIGKKGTMNPKQLQDMMAKAQEMQRQMQQRMQEMVVEATAGGGSVSVRMNGAKQMLPARSSPN